MSGKPLKIVVLDGFCTNPGDLSWDGLTDLGETTVHDRTSAQEAASRAAGAQVILTNKVVADRDLLSQLPDLRYIGVLATGFNVVDIETARERGITVTNIPAYGTHSVAQHAIALLLELTNQVARHNDAAQSGEWGRSPDWSFARAPLVELAGKTLGIIGFGRIGQQTARIGHALGMRILAYSHRARQNGQGAEPGDGPGDFPFTWISLKGLLEESDVVSLHCPLTPDTRHIVNAQTLKRMKPSARLINTSRGPLIDEAALAAALREGVIGGAAVDVLEEEPPASGSPLLGAPNCIVTPHIAWATREARSRLLETAIENVRAWMEGRPRNVVS
jgi:glycerate dehydrogenase